MSNITPNLINEKMVSDVANKITKSQTFTDTNMMVDYFANDDKLVGSDERVYYGQYNENGDDDDDNINLDDEIDSYKPSKSPKNVFNEHQPKHNSTYSDAPAKKTKKQESHNDDSYADSSTAVVKEKPHDPDDESMMSEEEIYLRKLNILRQLGELSMAGVKLSRNYGMNSDYKAMKYEYDLHTGVRSKKNAISWMSGMMIGIVKGFELLNDNLNPFDIKFDNSWSSKVSADITDYYDVLGELYEKYTTPGKKMAPELKLFFMLSGSAVQIQMFKGISNLTSGSAKELDDDPKIINDLRLKTNEDAQKKLNEKIEKEHAMVSERAKDLAIIHNGRNEYNAMQQRASGNHMDNFNKTLLLSESCKSNRKTDTDQSSLPSKKSFHDNSFLIKSKKEMDLMAQNKKLLEMQQALQNMREEDARLTESASKQKKSKQAINDSESSSKNKKYNNDSDTKKKSKKSQIINDDDSNSSSLSTVSLNPNYENILESAVNGKKIYTSSSDSSSSKKNKKKEVFLSRDLFLSDTSDKNKTKSKNVVKVVDREEAESRIKPELISFGKKSNGSGSTGASKKRGRPKKESLRFTIG